MHAAQATPTTLPESQPQLLCQAANGKVVDPRTQSVALFIIYIYIFIFAI